MTRPLVSHDPLAAFLVPGAPGAGFGAEIRTGLVRIWDTTTGVNEVELDGVGLSNVPILDTVDVATARVGQFVALLGTRDSRGVVTYAVIGTFRRPPF